MTGLQKTGHRDSPYERPNQKWVCGWADDGDACPLGPDGRGNCPAQMESQCLPRRVGDQFRCTRPAAFGGPCTQGPLPEGSCCHPTPRHALCQPQPSLRARRGRLVWLVLATTIGVLALALGGTGRLAAISPGGLVAAHEPIPPPPGARVNCAACHAAASAGGFGAWVMAAFASDVRMGDSEKCLGCHFRDNARFAMAAHNVAPAALGSAEPVKNRRSAALFLASFSRVTDAQQQDLIPCATCHLEHRGAAHAIAHMDNARCQACHRVVFDDFAGSHPEFGPLRHARSGIVFDHRTHKNTHFGKDRPFDCAACHALDASRRVETTLGYETACAGCHSAGKADHHGAKIRGEELLMFQLPDLGAGLIGVSWRSTAPTGPEVSGPMQLLLAGDEMARPALASLMQGGGDPSDWPEGDDDKSLRRALAAGVDRLLDDLQVDDHAWLRRRAAQALGVEADSPDAGDLANELEDTQRELRGALAGLIGSVAEAPATQDLAMMLSGPAPSAAPVQARLARAACAAASKDACVAISSASAAAALKARDEALNSAASALHVAVDDPRLPALFADAAAAPVRLRLRIARALGVGLDDARVEALLVQLSQGRVAVQQWRGLIVDGAPVAAAPAGTAGWNLRAKDGAVVYRPAAHADALMRAYIDAALALSAQPAESVPAALRNHVGEAARAAECLRCHAVDRSAAGVIVNWGSAGRNLDASGFSNFNHAPHVDLMSRQGCSHCHQVAPDKERGAQARGLLPHPRAACAECHNPGQTNADCVACHRYHFVPANG